MELSQHQRASEIFEAVIDLPAHQRQQALLAACGEDETLLVLVSRLVALDATASPVDDFEVSAAPHWLAPPEPLSAGAVVGDYTLVRLLGSGGTAQVWEAEHRTLGVRRALKVLSWVEASLQRQLLWEGWAQARLQHPNLLSVHGVVPVGAGLGLLLPLVDGPTLRQLLTRHRPSQDEAVALLHGIVSGIHHAHQSGLIHRDLKPDNVLLSIRAEGLRPLVADFGLVKGTASPASSGAMGTLNYAAPEQLRDGARVDHRADLFSLGVIFAELLGGRRPFQASSISESLAAYHRGPDLSAVPPRWRALLAELLREHPDERIMDCSALLEVLSAALHGRPDPLAPRTPLSRAAGGPSTARFGRADSHPGRDAFVGRAPEQFALLDALGSARLITLLGTAGVGKTRFIQHFASQHQEMFEGGVRFCDLRDARSRAGMRMTVARALGVSDVEQLEHALAARGRCLVILDNFEQIVGCAGVVDSWLAAAGEAVFVVTSRITLGLSAERVFPLQPLAAQDAVALFVARAALREPSFALTDGLGSVVAELVEQLDRLPLAIELAAARIADRPPQEMLKRLDQRFRLLRSPQATLQGALDWSWDLLEDWERAAFVQCSVFEGGFSLDAAEAILDLSAFPDAPWPMSVVQSLVDKSLLHPLPDERLSEPRFGMLRSLHAYASAKRPDSATLIRRHGLYYAGFGKPDSLNSLMAHGGDAQWWALAAELDNLITAHQRAEERGDASTTAWTALAAVAVLRRQNLTTPAIQLLERALALLQASEAAGGLEGRIQGRLGWLYRIQSRWDDAFSSHQAALKLHREQGDRAAEVEALNQSGAVRLRQLRFDEARTLLETSLRVARSHNALHRAGSAHNNLGSLFEQLGQLDKARAEFEQALRLHQHFGNRVDECSALSNLGVVLLRCGEVDAARARFEQALLLARALGDERNQAHTCGHLASLYRSQARPGEARAYYRKSLALYRRSGNRRAQRAVIAEMGMLAEKQDQPDQARTLYSESIEIARQLGDLENEVAVLGTLALLCIAHRWWRDARASLERALEIAVAEEMRSLEGQLHGYLAEVLGELGAFTEGLEHASRGVELLAVLDQPLHRIRARCFRAALLVKIGNLDAARVDLARARALAAGQRVGAELIGRLEVLEAALSHPPG